jgi:hypothetical protein
MSSGSAGYAAVHWRRPTFFALTLSKAILTSKRLKELNSPNLSIIFEYETKYPTQLEKALHFRFKNYNIEREWFNLNDFTLDEMKKICYTLNEGISSIKENKLL